MLTSENKTVHSLSVSEKNLERSNTQKEESGSPDKHDNTSSETVLLNSEQFSKVSAFEIQLLGSDMVGCDSNWNDVVESYKLRLNPNRFTPCAGFNLGKLKTFADCRNNLAIEPSNVLFVALPGFGTCKGNRHSNRLLTNICELVLFHLQNDQHHAIIDGATGNPAWKHPSTKNLMNHEQMTGPTEYYWCTAGVQMEGKPFRRKSFVMSTLPLTQISKWSRCCGKFLSEHLTARNCSSWKQSKPTIADIQEMSCQVSLLTFTMVSPIWVRLSQSEL